MIRHFQTCIFIQFPFLVIVCKTAAIPVGSAVLPMFREKERADCLNINVITLQAEGKSWVTRIEIEETHSQIDEIYENIQKMPYSE